jgi:hypothetical protein
MKIKPPKVFVRVLLFGLLLGASSTAYADTVAFTNFSFATLTFNPVHANRSQRSCRGD